MVSRHRARLVGALVVAALVLGGCIGGDGQSDAEDQATLQELADVALATEPGVDRVEVAQERSDGSVAMSVVMAPEATVDQVAMAAGKARTFSSDHVTDARWRTDLYLGEPPDAALQVELFPTVREDAGSDVRSAASVRSLPGVDRVAMTAGTPYVTAADASTLADLVPLLRAHELWTDGGSVQTEAGRVRLMDEPRRVSEDQLVAIVRAAVDHPDGEFWLEAAVTGDRYPELYVNRITTAGAADVVRRFSASDLTGDNAEGYELDFTVRASDPADPNQPVDSFGTFGRSS